jgi:hypothetical protein
MCLNSNVFGDMQIYLKGTGLVVRTGLIWLRMVIYFDFTKCEKSLA